MFAKVGDTVYTPTAMWGATEYCCDQFGGTDFYLPNGPRKYVPAMTKAVVVATGINKNVLKTKEEIYLVDERTVR
jgi:hypothetical protein